VGAWGLAGTLSLLAIPGAGLGGTLLGFWGTGATLATVGLFAGFFSVPLQVYLQAKTPSEQKGRIIGAMNLMNWIGICLSSAIYGVANLVLVKTARLPHASVFGVAALLIVLIALFYRPPNLILQTTDPQSPKNSPDRA
jgi:acyl-[acyl-carrier-protein]-phospholipid O-acyltransferase/long-chain-fatty-acid--[acyl-carrier-protein] ligase